MSEFASPEIGMAAKKELQLGSLHAIVRPNAEITYLEMDGKPVLFPADKLRTLSDPSDKSDKDAIPDTNVEGGSFIAWPFGRRAKKYISGNSAIHGVAAMLTQWKTIPVASEFRKTLAVLVKEGGRYFEEAFGNDKYSLHRVVALTGLESAPQAKLSTTVLYNGGENQDIQGNFYSLAEHSYFQVASYDTARIAYINAEGKIQTKLLKDFEVVNDKGKKVLDTDCRNEEVEAKPGEIWLLPEGESGRVVVIKRTVTLQRVDGSISTTEVPSSWQLYHKMDSERTEPAAIAIEAVAGEYDVPTMLSAGERVTQTVDISTVASLDELKM